MFYQWYYLAPDVEEGGAIRDGDDDEHVPQRRDDFETKYLKELLMHLDDMLTEEESVPLSTANYMKIGLELKILEQLNMQTATMTNLLEEFRKLARMVSSS